MPRGEWYTLSKEAVERKASTSLTAGLSDEEAMKRLEIYGHNEIRSRGRRTLLRMYVEQFNDVMIMMLITAAIISGFLRERVDAIVILLIVILNAIMGALQENKAENALAALKSMAAPKAKVLRKGSYDIIPAGQLVPGDVVILETGALVPADIRITEAFNLKIQEAVLTGESLAVEKHGDALAKNNVPLGERMNMGYSGSTVTYGHGLGIVVATGMETEMGQIAKMIQAADRLDTPLNRKLRALGKGIGLAVIGICVLMFLIGISYGRGILDMFVISVSLAVAAIPEGLPAIATIVLALGVQRMVKRNAIVRRLPSVETLGSATVICTDKTGTLTQNKMMVKGIFYNNEIHTLDEEGPSLTEKAHFELLVTAAVLCNDSKLRKSGGDIDILGDPTETALVDFGLKSGIYKDTLEAVQPRADEVPFDSKRKLMTTVHAFGGGYRVYTKGAVEEVLKISKGILIHGQTVELTDGRRDLVLAKSKEMAQRALRVLALAYKGIDTLESNNNSRTGYEGDLVFIGLLGLMDPPRPECKEAVSLCRRAGIKPVMITGDYSVTAIAIARDLGLLTDEGGVISGIQLDNMDDEELRAEVEHTSVYARVSPEHKVRIVKAWQSKGQVVAMTGDGANDAPALKTADIGAAMGIVGTDVAKEAADIILTDDNFATVVAAVEEGRIVFANIQKAIQFLLSCNVGEVLTLFVATMFNLPQPLLPIHILWINLVTDSFPALALGMEPAEGHIMDEGPREPGENIFDKTIIIRIIYQGIMIGVLTLAAYTVGSRRSPEVGRTMAFTVLGFSQLVHSFNMRSGDASVFRMGLMTNKYLLAAAALSASLMLVVFKSPFLASVFELTALSVKEQVITGLLALAPIVIVEAVKNAANPMNFWYD